VPLSPARAYVSFAELETPTPVGLATPGPGGEYIIFQRRRRRLN
jgi:hypothetical protein